ncbi:tyrosinase central domain-containing protein [Favolaschia claudopus]|uniref:Tyrosinase central domain-containing protein n=1 Tax=Favolaschia claudopus TaxID=2862362 RepID=A0AAW0E6C9_9AGAR
MSAVQGMLSCVKEAALPYDLEREIFEFAAFTDAQTILKLILVAHRVKTWIEPLLSRIVSVTDPDRVKEPASGRRITGETFLEMLDLRNGASAGNHVRHISIANITSTDELALARALSSCVHAVNVALFNIIEPHLFLRSIAKMPLQRLAADLPLLFAGANIDMNHSIFSRLTHLDLFDIDVYAADSRWPQRFSHIPFLTHISFNFHPLGIPTQPVSSHRMLLSGILQDCKQLEVLVLICAEERLVKSISDKYPFFAEDTRSVILVVADFLQDWEAGASGGIDYWRRAEIGVRKRQLGQISGSAYVVA